MTEAWSDILSDLSAAHRDPNNRSKPCQVCDALDQMPEDVRSEIERYIMGKLVGRQRISRILTDRGYPTGERAVDNHQKGHP